MIQHANSGMTVMAPRWFNVAIGVLLVLLVAGGGVAAALIAEAERRYYSPVPYYYSPKVAAPVANPPGVSAAALFPEFPATNPLADLPVAATVVAVGERRSGTMVMVRLSNRDESRPLVGVTLLFREDVPHSSSSTEGQAWLEEFPIMPGKAREVAVDTGVRLDSVTTAVPVAAKFRGANDTEESWLLSAPVPEADDPTFPPAGRSIEGNVALVYAGRVDGWQGSYGLPVFRVYNLDGTRTLSSLTAHLIHTDSRGNTHRHNAYSYTLPASNGLPPRHSMLLVGLWQFREFEPGDGLEVWTNKPAWRLDESTPTWPEDR